MRHVMIAAAATCVLCASAAAEPAEQWRALTRGDVEAAHALLMADHPAASRTLSDPAFRATLERNYHVARERSGQVESYDGYVATMAGFANGMGDRHIWSRPIYRSDTMRWAGLMIAKHGARYVVTADERGESAGASLVGAALTSCDGVAAETFAADKLGGFRGVWSIEAQRVQAAPFLLVDDGNPFVLRPAACAFERDGATETVTLEWRDISRTDLRTRTAPAMNMGAAGFGVRDVGDAVWISIQSLDERAPAVAEAVVRDGERLRAAPLVVLDLRGNGGGNSSFARPIEVALFGQARYDAVTGGAVAEEACGSVWRVSPRNIATLQGYLVEFASATEVIEELRAIVADAEAAQAAGREFSGDVQCGAATAAPAAPADLPPQAARGRIVLLTDNACFSSCLIVADEMRRLGALHVGNATNGNTHYSEVRQDRMPSGLSVFSTLQAMMPASPAAYGPFEPTYVYDGDMADNAALEAWVAQVAAN